MAKTKNAAYDAKTASRWRGMLFGLFAALMGVVCLLSAYLAILLAIDGAGLARLICVPIFAAIFCFALCILWHTWAWMFAKFRIAPEGIWAKYPLQQERLTVWKDFQQICVCYSGFTTQESPRKAASVIACVRVGERRNMYGRWKTDNPFRYRGVLTMPYTQQLCEKLALYSCKAVEDLRDLGNYRL